MATVEERQAAEEDAIAEQMSPDDGAGDVDELAEPAETGDVDAAAADGADDPAVDDGQADAAGETPEHPDEAAIRAAADAEAQLKKLSGTADRYVKKLIELLGPELGGYDGCALCDGFPPGLVILAAIDDERRELVKRQLGLETLDNVVVDEAYVHRCDTCQGRGIVRTGSYVHDRETVQCRTCQGAGYVRLGVKAVEAPAGEPTVLPPVVEGAPTDRPPYDVYGTPSWHADYGKMVDMRDVPVAHWAGNLPTE